VIPDSGAFTECCDVGAVTIMTDVVVYIHDGVPTEVRNYGLMTDLRPVLENNWISPLVERLRPRREW
jgi:hypothetical protein